MPPVSTNVVHNTRRPYDGPYGLNEPSLNLEYMIGLPIFSFSTSLALPPQDLSRLLIWRSDSAGRGLARILVLVHLLPRWISYGEDRTCPRRVPIALERHCGEKSTWTGSRLPSPSRIVHLPSSGSNWAVEYERRKVPIRPSMLSSGEVPVLVARRLLVYLHPSLVLPTATCSRLTACEHLVL